MALTLLLMAVAKEVESDMVCCLVVVHRYSSGREPATAALKTVHYDSAGNFP